LVHDIEKILKGSELAALADFLTDPDSEITDCIICYQSGKEAGYNYLTGSSYPTIIGLLDIAHDLVKYEIDAFINGGIEEDEID
jgi:hypothetical protein